MNILIGMSVTERKREREREARINDDIRSSRYHNTREGAKYRVNSKVAYRKPGIKGEGRERQ